VINNICQYIPRKRTDALIYRRPLTIGKYNYVLGEYSKIFFFSSFIQLSAELHIYLKKKPLTSIKTLMNILKNVFRPTSAYRAKIY